MDTILLSRIQFAVTTLFHILFPALTIGLSVYLVAVELLWLLTKQELYYRLYRFWVRFFAINFGVGVVTGIVLEFEFGTNFSPFSQAVSSTMSPLLAFEVMTAFFLESGFLGIMLFGWNRVSRGMHFISTCLVALGTVISAFWILAANSWMQTPAGYQLANGKFLVTDFGSAILNPSAWARMEHMTMAAFETSAFVISGISAYYLLVNNHVPLFRKSLGIALVMAALFAPLQIYFGDRSGVVVFEHQPAKLAAMESHWSTNTSGGAPLIIFAMPDESAEKNSFELSIPDGLSLLATRTLAGKVPGLKEFARQDRPNVLIPFWAFRVMAGIGFLYLGIMIWAFRLWLKKKLFTSRSFLWTLLIAHPLGFVALETGWIVNEVGRQPWLVYNVMRTTEGVSHIPDGNVIWSLVLFLIIFAVIGSGFAFYILKLIRKGPDVSSAIPPVQRRAGMVPFQDTDTE